jgi:MFS transporter, OFA family, oxalate/formate antiporter
MVTATGLDQVPTFTKARTIMCASFCNLMIGSYYFFSNINSYVAAYLRQYNPSVSSKDTLLIMPLWIIFQSIGTIVSTRLVKKYGGANVSNFAYLSFALCNLAMVWNKSYLLFVLVYGVVTGLSIGIGYMPSLVIAWTYFPDQKSIVTGVCLFSAGISASILSPSSTAIVNPDNIIEYETDPNVYNRVPLLFFCMFAFFGGLNVLMFLFQPQPFETETKKEEQAKELDTFNSRPKNPLMRGAYEDSDDENYGSPSKKPAKGGQANKVAVAPKKEAENAPPAITKSGCPSLPIALRSKHFYMLAYMAYSCSIYNYFMNSVWKGFYQTKIVVGDSQMALILSYGAMANSVVRVASGFIMMKHDFKVIFIPLVVSTIVSCFTIHHFLNSYAMGVIYSMTVFGGIGIQVTIFPTVCNKTFGTELGPSVFPFVFSCFSLANLTQFFLLKFTDSWALMFNLYGAIAISGLVVGYYFNTGPNWDNERNEWEAHLAQEEGKNTQKLIGE